MLKQIDIENYILIDKLSIDIGSGLNIITGETGAGKSILLGAISLLLGGRGDVSLIKQGAKQLVIEAHFDVTSLKSYLEPIFACNEIDFDSELTVRRIITSNGKSKSFLNEEPVNISFLKEIGSYLVDIHSQHQTLLLSSRAFQTEIVDCMADQQNITDSYVVKYKNILSIKQRIVEFEERSKQLLRDKEYLQFQFDQLDEAMLKDGEQEELESERDVLSNASSIAENLYGFTTIVNGGEDNVISMLQHSNTLLSKVKSYIPSGDELYERIVSSIIELKDVVSEVENIASDIEENPTRLEAVEARLNLIYTLQQKHSKDSILGLLELKNDLELKLSNISQLDGDIESLKKELNVEEQEAWVLAESLRCGRKGVSDSLKRQIVENLITLGMPNAKVEVVIEEQSVLGQYGADHIEFLFSANGGNLEKIDKVASGGEMSRLMLTLKSIVAHHRTMPTIIFDEIDTGVSGRVADSMGAIMEALAKELQIINITHLPQVASKGEHHLYVYKEHIDGHSVSRIVKLSETERVEQIAMMLSGNIVTDAAKQQARMLLKKK